MREQERTFAVWYDTVLAVLKMDCVDLPVYGVSGVAVAIAPGLGINLVSVANPVIYANGNAARLSFDGSSAGLASEQSAVRTARIDDVREFQWNGDIRERIYGTATTLVFRGTVLTKKLYFTQRRICDRYSFVLGNL